MDTSAPPGTEEDRGLYRRTRIARWIVLGSLVVIAGVIVFFSLTNLGTAASTGENPRSAFVGAVLSLPLSWYTYRLLKARVGGGHRSGERDYWISLVLLAATAAFIGPTVAALFIAGAWWSAAVLVAPRRRTLAVSAVLLAAPWVWFPALGSEDLALMPLFWVGATFWALVMAAGNLGVVWLWEVANEALNGREARARLAVTEERLRFARDMHDLLGHSLSALAVKAELAAKLAERDPGRAGREMAQVQALAREALQQVRGAVSGYREVDLAAEAESVRAVLRANGTDCRVSGIDGADLPPQTAALAAWVVREGGTNVLRHSRAARCDISLSRVDGGGAGGALMVEVYNDRADGAGGEHPAESGNGLAGLSERVAMAGGTLSASTTPDGGFLLRAVIPAGRGG